MLWASDRKRPLLLRLREHLAHELRCLVTFKGENLQTSQFEVNEVLDWLYATSTYLLAAETA